MTDEDVVIAASKRFLSFRKSGKVAIPKLGVEDFLIVVKALRLHLLALARGKIIEDYRIESLGEWIGRGFPSRVTKVLEMVDRLASKVDQNAKRPEVFTLFRQGMGIGKKIAEETTLDPHTSRVRSVRYEVVHPD
jgi:hypothetical protein